MRPAIDAISRRTARGALIGTAGSGKSSGLQHLYELFAEQAREVQLLHDITVDIPGIPLERVLLVDDLHLLSEQRLQQLGERAEDPAASLIIARRPWPTRPALRAITQRLEQHAPAIVLGHVTRADLLDRLESLDLRLPEACIEHILEATRGIAWLVAAAVQYHDPRECAHDGAHTALDRALAQHILHRLDTIDDRLRRTIEEVCVAAPGEALTDADAGSDWALQGYAQGLLLRNGEAAPVVRLAVREALPAHRLIDLCTRFPGSLRDPEGLRPLRDERVADALISSADRILPDQPHLAGELYTAAVQCGAQEQALAPRRASAAWSAGALDEATTLAENALASGPGRAQSSLIAVAAAAWSARALMSQAHRVSQAVPPSDAVTGANATIAALGVGAEDPGDPPRESGALPSALSVSTDLLRGALRSTLGPRATESPLTDLVRSAEIYTTSRRSDPLCELPAVVAAVVALNLGRLATAQTVLDDAIARDHGGPWGRTRLLLWRAWVAAHRAHPAEARSSLQSALAGGRERLCTRDALLLQAVRVAIARRYEDAAGLEAAWQDARPTLLRADVDLFLLHPLGELASAAARAGDAARVEPHLQRAQQIVESLGSPPLWASHVHWAGIQQGILLSRPDRLAPHARALVNAAAHSRVAAGMAKAGRVWTDVLAGSVDVDAVVSAAEGLAAAGLIWDAARLAGHGAARSTDRKVAAQLLACARELHPNDGPRRPVPTADDDAPAQTKAAPADVLSDREIEVARLVLQGKTYAEIGEAIFISPRTAEHHIAHIRHRLGAASRSELLARLRLLLGEGTPDSAPQDETP
ncbi:LuxR C-terminal-related transcriptional regulator [Microbacterium sp. MAHUQ-60]|uniref:LuxR C-terminal-related transcriptional regulator n=1 Tax=unclassified Microbacterium TaxID=2609290 RepID=UPI00360C8C0D